VRLKIFFLLALFFLNLTSVKADIDINNIANNFYKKINTEILEKENTVLINKLNKNTNIPTETLNNIIKFAPSKKDEEIIAEYCKEKDKNVYNSDCREKLEQYLKFELDLNEMDQDLGKNLEVSQIYSNGTLADSPFDLVVDLNIIDVLLFGSKARIPLALFEFNSNKNNPNQANVSKKLAGENNFLKDYFGKNSEENQLGENLEDKNNEDFFIEAKDFEEILLKKPNITADNLMCVDPNSLIFLNLEDLEKDNYNDQTENLDKKIEIKNQTEYQKLLEQREWVKNQNNIQTNCKNHLYGGYFCADNSLKNLSLDSSNDNCDLQTGNCEKCFVDSSGIRFCLVLSLRKTKNSLFSSEWVEDSVRSYLEDILKNTESLLSSTPLTPKKNQNQGGFITHLWDFFGNIGDNMSVRPKVIDLASKEAYLLPEIKEDTQKIINISKFCEQIDKSETEIYEGISLSKIKENQELLSEIKEICYLKNYEELKQESVNQKQQLYYQNIERNLQELRSVFKTNFLDNTKNFPFLELKLLKQGNKICE
jgi:hypothetical protein